MNFPTRIRDHGRWDLDKRPVVDEYNVSLRCGVCLRREELNFRVERIEGSWLTGDPARYPGTWRKVGMGGSHADPLPQETTVCSKECAAKFFATEVEELYP